jgi:hypothetical protein
MSYTDVVSRIDQIQAQMAAVQAAFTPASAAAATQTAAGSATAAPPTTGPGSFANALAQAQSATPAGAASDPTAAAATGALGALTQPGALAGTTSSTALPASAQKLLTSGQQQFASRLAAQTGLDPGVIGAWVLSEESSGAAQSRQAANNNDWLNIGYTDSGTYGSSDSIWSNPITAADATAGWLKGQDTIPGYGTASSGIQAILKTAGQAPSAQISALQNSGWASSGYPSLPGLYQQVAG